MTESRQLLADYAETGSEPAFRELVGRYINLVYSTALRLAGGNRPLAEDITQTVFINLAELARTISPNVMLGGWLHQRTFHVATKAVRAEKRRQNRESEAALMKALNEDFNPGLGGAAPMLDEAITQLGDEDRTAILLRFFEQRDFRAVGAALGSNENAARMRVNRALEKLHVILKARGVTLSAATLGTALAAEAIVAAPAGLAATVAGVGLAGTAAGGITATIIKVMAITKLKLVAGGLVAGLTAVVVVQTNNASKLRDQNTELQKQLVGMEHLRAENERLASVKPATNESALSPEQLSELLRLRGQVGSLKRQMAAAQAAAKQPPAVTPVPNAPDPNVQKKVEADQAMVTMNRSRQLLLAFMMYANDNDGRFPSGFDKVTAYLGNDNKNELMEATNHFDVMYHGTTSEMISPSTTIVLRESTPVQISDGGWMRTYAFADGHSEVHRSEDGDFSDWEASRIVKPSGK